MGPAPTLAETAPLESMPECCDVSPIATGHRAQLQRVSILASDLSPQGAGRWGAAGVRPFLLAQALKQAGYEPEVLGFADSSVATDGPAPIHTLPRHWRSIPTMLQRLRGDWVIAYKLKPSSFGLALLRRLRHHRPLILDIDDWELSWHGGDAWRYRPSPRQLARDLLKPDGALRQPDHPFYLQQIEHLVPWADRVTTHSSFLQQRFGGTYLPNGKDTDLFNPQGYDSEAARQRCGLQGIRVLMFPGAPRPYKGVEDMLAALDLLDQPDLKLVIVGGSPYDDYDQTLQQRWGHRMIYLPKTPYLAMPELLAAAHVVVVPQRDTPAAAAQFPLKLTDGMAMAKPVLATRVGDIPQVLGDAGYLADAGSPQQLAEQITQIFASYNQALQRGERARQRCIQSYSIEAMGRILSRLLPSLL